MGGFSHFDLLRIAVVRPGERLALPFGPFFSYTEKMFGLSIPVDEKKRGRPRGSRFVAPVPVRMTAEISAALDVWIAAQPEPKPSRSEAIRIGLSDWLASLGHLPHRDDPEMAN